MPLRLDALLKDDSPDILSWMLGVGLQNPEDIFASKDGQYLHMSNALMDAKTNTQVGRYIFTIFLDTKRKTLSVRDVDIVLDNTVPVCLDFISKYKASSDANEYYEVVTEEMEQHLCIETVNRHTISGDILGTKQAVYASAFPFKVAIYDDLADLNRAVGFDERLVKVGDEEYAVGGLSDTFTGVGGVFSGEQAAEEDIWTLMVGVVDSYQNVALKFGDTTCEACIVQLKTALGMLPTVMGKELFETDKLAPGKVVLMNACIKANFVQDKYRKE